MHENPVSLERQAEIDTGYDYRFERRWGRFERLVWLFFVLLITLAMVGILGRGPLNQVRRTFEDGSSVQYERVLRFKSATVVNFHVPVENGAATLEASQELIQKLGLQWVTPTPTQVLGSDQIGPLEFRVSSPHTKSVLMQFSMQPGAVGPVTSSYRLNGKTMVQIEQFIVP